MNLNLTSTAPVRFSIPERFALQKKNIKEARHLLSRTVPPRSSCTCSMAAGLFQQEKSRGLGMGSIWESHLHPLPLRTLHAAG